MAKNDGGPAFPTDPERGVSHKGDIYRSFMGMTLRDAFAIAVRQSMGNWTPDYQPVYGAKGILACLPKVGDDSARDRLHRAEWAYAEADAMLKAREGEG